MILDKDQLKYITQAITPDQTTYVALVSNILNSVPEEKLAAYKTVDGETSQYMECPLNDDLLFLNKIQAFIIKIKDIEWLINVETLKYKLNDLYYALQDFLNRMVPLFRLAYNYEESLFSALTLPNETDVLCILNDLKDTVFGFINKKYDCPDCENPERLSMKHEAQNCLSTICKTLYEYRLARCGSEYTKAIVSAETKEPICNTPVQTVAYSDEDEYNKACEVPCAYTPEYIRTY